MRRRRSRGRRIAMTQRERALLEALEKMLALFDDEGDLIERHQDQISCAIEAAEKAIADYESSPNKAGSGEEVDYVLVPREPRDEILTAMWNAYRSASRSAMTQVYKAVTSNAPSPSQDKPGAGWISVYDSLPDEPERVYWTFSTKYGYQSTMFKSRGWAGGGRWGENPTYSTQELGITYWSRIVPSPSTAQGGGNESR